eukprot:2682084-Pleurochrysis_carterae.AAC.1
MLSGQLQRKRRLETFEVPACLLSACGINAASHRQGKHQSTSWFTSSKRKPKGLKQGRALRKRIGARCRAPHRHEREFVEPEDAHLCVFELVAGVLTHDGYRLGEHVVRRRDALGVVFEHDAARGRPLQLYEAEQKRLLECGRPVVGGDNAGEVFVDAGCLHRVIGARRVEARAEAARHRVLVQQLEPRHAALARLERVLAEEARRELVKLERQPANLAPV